MMSSSVSTKDIIYEINGLNLDSVNAVIELSGSVSGTIILTLSDETAVKLVTRLLGIEVSELDQDVFDGISEMLNIIAGGAKANLPGSQESPIHLGIPRIFQDINGYSTNIKEWARIPFDSEWGSLELWVALE